MSFLTNLFKTKAEKAIDAYEPTVDSGAATGPSTVPIDMSKHSENLDKVLINMSKDKKIDMSKHTARVAMVLDYSGSMDVDYNNGKVQDTISRLLPISLKFDDNGELESWIFSDDERQLEPVTIDNYENYVRKVIRRSHMGMGGTYYAPVLNEVIHYYKDIEPSSIPAFIIFITDGDNFDHGETDEVVRELSNYNMFVQFVGLGRGGFNYLESLDDLSGRKHDNTGFITVNDMAGMDDQKLYKELLRQYVAWLNGKQ